MHENTSTYQIGECIRFRVLQLTVAARRENHNDARTTTKKRILHNSWERFRVTTIVKRAAVEPFPAQIKSARRRVRERNA